MKINHYTDLKAVKLMATKSRKIETSSLELYDLHVKMGIYLGNKILEEFDLKEIQINHVQGIKTGFNLDNPNNITIIAMLRAGYPAAHGIRQIFPESSFIMADKDFDPLKEDPAIADKTVIVVDSVINTGKSIRSILNKLIELRCKHLIIATLLMQSEAALTEEFPGVVIYALRVSNNKYKGIGGTDTGNRLFNTINRK